MPDEVIGITHRVIQPPVASSIMALAAHPDDIETWCAGTLARMINLGGKVRLLLVTSGDKGSNDRDADPMKVARVREREAVAAARLLGLDDIAFLRYPDGDVEDTRALRGDLVRWIRTWRPDILFTHDPEHPVPPYLTHRGHRIVGRATLDAVYPLARDPLTFREQLDEGLGPHAVRQVWLFASAAADVFVDIAPTFYRKVAARVAHASQTTDPDALRSAWKRRFAEIGASAGLRAAKSFTVLDLS